MASSRLMLATRTASYLRISVPFRGLSSGALLFFVCVGMGHWTSTYKLVFLHGSGVAIRQTLPDTHILVVKDLRYSDSHEWAKVDGNAATIGITDHAQDHLGDAVYVELPEIGASVSQGGSFGAVESVKASSDVYSPVSGKIIEVNEELSSSPGLINASPYEKGWIIKVEMGDKDEINKLMESDQYSKFCQEEDAEQ